jgi:hypothetical protein
MERWSIKHLKKKATRVVSLEKKMNSQPQNDIVLVKFHFSPLIFFISLNSTPDWIQTFSFVQFFPWRTSISAPNFSVFSYQFLVLDLYNLTLNWLLNFQLSLISPLISINWVPIVRRLLQNGIWLWISLIWLLIEPKTLIFLQVYPWFQSIGLIKIKYGLLKF